MNDQKVTKTSKGFESVKWRSGRLRSFWLFEIGHFRWLIENHLSSERSVDAIVDPGVS